MKLNTRQLLMFSILLVIVGNFFQIDKATTDLTGIAVLSAGLLLGTISAIGFIKREFKKI